LNARWIHPFLFPPPARWRRLPMLPPLLIELFLGQRTALLLSCPFPTTRFALLTFCLLTSPFLDGSLCPFPRQRLCLLSLFVIPCQLLSRLKQLASLLLFARQFCQLSFGARPRHTLRLFFFDGTKGVWFLFRTIALNDSLPCDLSSSSFFLFYWPSYRLFLRTVPSLFFCSAKRSEDFTVSIAWIFCSLSELLAAGGRFPLLSFFQL